MQYFVLIISTDDTHINLYLQLCIAKQNICCAHDGNRQSWVWFCFQPWTWLLNNTFMFHTSMLSDSMVVYCGWEDAYFYHEIWFENFLIYFPYMVFPQAHKNHIHPSYHLILKIWYQIFFSITCYIKICIMPISIY